MWPSACLSYRTCLSVDSTAGAVDIHACLPVCVCFFFLCNICVLKCITNWSKCDIVCIFDHLSVSPYIYTSLLWLHKLHWSRSDGTSKTTFNQYEAMLGWNYFKCAPQNAVLLKMHWQGWAYEAWWVRGLLENPGPSSEHYTWLWRSWACWVWLWSCFWYCCTRLCSSGDPDGSPAVQAATERSLLLDVQLLNHKRRQGSERRRKINPVHRAYPLCAANLLSL